MNAKVTCECGIVNFLYGREELIRWANNITHRPHYPAQICNTFTIDLEAGWNDIASDGIGREHNQGVAP